MSRCRRCAALDQLDDLAVVQRAGGVWGAVFAWFRSSVFAELDAAPRHTDDCPTVIAIWGEDVAPFWG